jgi:hypothetical protein
MTISAAAIDLMVGAGASCVQLAIVARQHFPKISETIDALISADTPVAVVAALIKAEAADCGAAAREAKKREANNRSQQKCRGKKRAKHAEEIRVNEPELDLSSVSYDVDDRRDSDDRADPSPSSTFPPHPPNNYSPSHSEPDGSDAVASSDPKLILFRDGLADLATMGVIDAKLGRRMLGRWLRDCGGNVARVVSAITEAKAQGPPADPIPYITRLLNSKITETRNDNTGQTRTYRAAGRDQAPRDPTVAGVARYAAKQGLV